MDSNQAAQQLHHIEHNMEHLEGQRKTFQNQTSEIETALEELQGKDDSYKIIGAIMVKRSASVTIAELEEKKRTLSIRIQAIEKQEQKLTEKIREFQDIIIEQNKK